MKTEKSRLIQIAILAALGLAAALSLALPQLLRGEREPQLLSLTVLLRDTDSSGWTVARQGMEQAADELGAELRFLTLAAANDGAEQEELLLREIEDGAAALVVVPADPAALSAQLERGNLAAIAAWSDYAAGYLAVRRAVNAVRGTGGALGPLPFFILREEDIYAPENQKLLFPIMSSSSR